MGDAREEPRQRRRLEGPADRDPLLVELERDGDRHERERRSRHEGEAPEVARRGRLDAQERHEEKRQGRGDADRQDRDEAVPPRLGEARPAEKEECGARQDRRDPRGARGGRAPGGQRREGEEEEPEKAREEKAGNGPLRARLPRVAPEEDGEEREAHGDDREAVPPLERRDDEERPGEEEVGER